VADSFEHSNEQPGSTKCGEFLDQLMDCYPGKQTLLPAVSSGPFRDALSISDYGPYMIDGQWNGETMECTGHELLEPFNNKTQSALYKESVRTAL
jgi:hypothetical protein